MQATNKMIKRYRRFHGYDYGRGASIFVTFVVKGRLPLFGRVEGDKVALSPAGLAARESILFENKRPGRHVWAASFVVMPDHIHMRLVLEPGAGEEPLRHVGQFVNNVKRWSRKHAAVAGVKVEWEENYHDHICVSRFINIRFQWSIDRMSKTLWLLPRVGWRSCRASVAPIYLVMTRGMA